MLSYKHPLTAIIAILLISLNSCINRIELACKTSTDDGVREIYLVNYFPESKTDTRLLIESFTTQQTDKQATRVFYKRKYLKNPLALDDDNGFYTWECLPNITQNLICIVKPNTSADTLKPYGYTWFPE